MSSSTLYFFKGDNMNKECINMREDVFQLASSSLVVVEPVGTVDRLCIEGK